MKIKWKELIIAIAIPLAVGGLAALITRNSMDMYDSVTKPPLAPPAILFPIAWGVLYVLMGISSYIIYNSNSALKSGALLIYAVSLVVNFMWPILFFNMQAFLASFLWLVLLWALVLLTILQYRKISPLAAYLQIPYLLWLTFAGYLNFMIYILN